MTFSVIALTKLQIVFRFLQFFYQYPPYVVSASPGSHIAFSCHFPSLLHYEKFPYSSYVLYVLSTFEVIWSVIL